MYWIVEGAALSRRRVLRTACPLAAQANSCGREGGGVRSLPLRGRPVRAELVLKRKFARVKRESGRVMPTTFGAGTEVLPESAGFDLRDMLSGADVTCRFGSAND